MIRQRLGIAEEDPTAAAAAKLTVGLPQAPVATPEEILAFVEVEGLGRSGIGFVDAQLLASTRLEADCALWTLDRRLAAVAERLKLRWRRGNVTRRVSPSRSRPLERRMHELLVLRVAATDSIRDSVSSHLARK
ncbi:hypothetical protein BH24ACT23_BH24ACT23_09850 [soil metagenome]